MEKGLGVEAIIISCKLKVKSFYMTHLPALLLKEKRALVVHLSELKDKLHNFQRLKEYIN
jgi:hypothetical protein